jgi:hypothetical protein
MFNGTIERAQQYFQSLGKSYVINDIPWAQWGGQRPDWQYCVSTKYAGPMGGWLMNKKGTHKFFYLSEQPNSEAFDRMENFTSRPRGIVSSRGGSTSHVTCKNCRKSFRPEDPEKEKCRNCLENDLEEARINAEAENKKAESAALARESVENQIERLKQEFLSLTNSRNHCEANLEIARASLQEANKSLADLAAELSNEVEEKKKLSLLFAKFNVLVSKVAGTSTQVSEVEKKQRRIDVEKDVLRMLIDDVATELKLIRSTPFQKSIPLPSSNWAINQVASDILHMFSHVFGGARPNRNVSEHVITQIVRNWPPCCFSYVSKCGILYDQKVELPDFCKMMDDLSPGTGTKIKQHYNIGHYMNVLQEEVSITHMPYRDIVRLNDSIEESAKLPIETLQQWKRYSVVACKSLFAKHLFACNVESMISYQYITNIKCSLKERKYNNGSFDFWITFCTRSFRKINNKWEEDFPVRPGLPTHV